MAAAGALLGLPAPAVAQPPKPTIDEGVIAFSAKRGAARVIYTRKRNRTGLRRLRRLGGRVDHPAFTSLGRRLAFRRNTSLGAQIWVSYLDGTGLRPLTSGPADSLPDWSPSGEMVAFARGRRRRRDIYAIRADGAGLRRLTRSAADDHSPTWSVRNRVAFVRRRGRQDELYVFNTGSGAVRRLTRNRLHDSAPAFSPSGRTLLFSRGKRGRRDLYVMRSSGRGLRRVTRIRGEESDPTWSPDGKRIVFHYRRGRRRQLYVLRMKRGKPVRRISRNRRLRRLTTSRSASRVPDWQGAARDPMVAAAGDIACDPGHVRFNNGLGVPGGCRQKMTSDLLLRMDLSRILILGDIQYEDAKLWKFIASFHRSWGRLKPLISPVAGNHEWEDPGAAGHFDYFNGQGQQTGPAGERGKGWYSFDLGTWHVISLDSECNEVGGCGPGSPQMAWLRADLAANPERCTLVQWHRPRFTSGTHGEGSAVGVLPFWQTLYSAGADVIVNGHEHFYERFGPQSPTGAPDPARGIRQFISGAGGRNHHNFDLDARNSEFQDNETFGVLKLTLADGRYHWEYVIATSGEVLDRGSGLCH